MPDICPSGEKTGAKEMEKNFSPASWPISAPSPARAFSTANRKGSPLSPSGSSSSMERPASGGSFHMETASLRKPSVMNCRTQSLSVTAARRFSADQGIPAGASASSAGSFRPGAGISHPTASIDGSPLYSIGVTAISSHLSTPPSETTGKDPRLSQSSAPPPCSRNFSTSTQYPGAT